MPAAVENMFSHREVPWHGLGTLTEEAPTAAEAIKLAGLDWEVEKVPLVAPYGDLQLEVPDRFAMVRKSDAKYLATVGGIYEPVQNVEAFDFADQLVNPTDAEIAELVAQYTPAKYETAGSLRGGRTIFLSMFIPDDLKVAGEDPIKMYLMLRNSHDGSSKLGAYCTMIRPVCMNTVTMAVKQARTKWEMTHNRTVAGKIEEAKQSLALSRKYAQEFVQMGDELVSTTVSDNDIEALLEATIPARPKTDEVIKDIVALYNDSPTNGYKGTGWGLFNALTEYTDHVKESRSEEARFLSLTDGYAAGLRDKLVKVLLPA